MIREVPVGQDPRRAGPDRRIRRSLTGQDRPRNRSVSLPKSRRWHHPPPASLDWVVYG